MLDHVLYVSKKPDLENVCGLWSGRRCCPFYRSRPVFFLVFHMCIKHTYIAVCVCVCVCFSFYTNTQIQNVVSFWKKSSVSAEERRERRNKENVLPLPPEERGWGGQLPKILFYTFSKEKKLEEKIKQKIGLSLKKEINNNQKLAPPCLLSLALAFIDS